MTAVLRFLVAVLAAFSVAFMWLEGRNDSVAMNLRGVVEPACRASMERPPLSSLIDYEVTNENKIKGDVSGLLDFAIIGHPKTATTFTMEWIGTHKETAIYTHELHALQTGRPAEFVRLMYELPAGPYKRGYKAPRDIAIPDALDLLAKYWPNSKLIVGLRHPVLWFESFYNFRVRHGYSMPPADSPVLIGRCSEAAHGVCTSEALFHHHLVLLGKTAVDTPGEQGLFSQWPPKHRPQHASLPNKVFLYEISQLYHDDVTRSRQYRRDLADFLGLHETMPPIVRSSSNATRLREKVLDICEDQYKRLRHELLRNGKDAATWILEYFVDHEDVVVSSPDFFRELLESWSKDPCDDRHRLRSL